ncbi:hypothetical protein PybrP1_009902 [[Pythium] brassicae (nom. inval.)]|nr:hypothetical protein PybrP1_009902 [[Pythium] brassicae (nom. inval.)]
MMKFAPATLALVSTLAVSSAAAQVCQPSDGDSIKTWMNACDIVVGNSTAKCADSACHAALHRLEEEETHECWEFLGLGSHRDFDKYVALDTFCHGEGPDPSTTPAPGAPICTESDGFDILMWMNACDSVTGSSQSKCDDRGCHIALHRLEEEETHECWKFLGFGSHTDFDKYVALDTFCHGEGPDPAVARMSSTVNATTA